MAATIKTSGNADTITIETADGSTLTTVKNRILKCSVIGAQTITLPTAAGNNLNYWIIDNDTGQDFFVNAYGSETINDEATQIIPPNCSMSIYSNSDNWRIF